MSCTGLCCSTSQPTFFYSANRLEPSGLEPPTSWLQTRTSSCENSVCPAKNHDSVAAGTNACTPACTGALNGPADPALAAIVGAWAVLPEHVRQAIITLVEAAAQSDDAKR